MKETFETIDYKGKKYPLTIKKFNNLFSHYKNMFDLEMQLKAANMTYRKYYSKIQKQDEWF